MPVLTPNLERQCRWGHRLFFRTVPILGYDKMLVLGCAEQTCPQNMLDIIRDLATAEGIAQSIPT